MLKDPFAHREAVQVQRRARELANSGRLLEALQGYSQAEKLFREAFFTIGDRVFFTQQLALQCLEELLEENPELRHRYVTEASRFLDDWTEPTIIRQITAERRQEALWFREWRVKAFHSSNIFAAVTLEIRRADFIKAKELLDDLIQAVERTGGSERDALLAMAAARRAALPALIELEKRRVDRDLRLVTTAYYRAARCLRLNRASISRQKERIQALRHLNLSYARKYHAIDALLSGERRQLRADDSLALAVKSHERALAFACCAAELCASVVPPLYLPTLRYSAAVIRIRWSIVGIMYGREAAFSEALAAWREAVEVARQVCGDDESLLFPNRFYSLADLQSEIHFIRAARAFRERSWCTCIQHLEAWVETCPEDFRRTWRWSNVWLRLLSIRVVELGVSAADPSAIKAAIVQLRNFVCDAPVGHAAAFFAEQAQSVAELAAGGHDFSSSLGGLDRCFPLDSQTTYYETAHRREVLLSLPPRLARNFMLPPPTVAHEIADSRIAFLAALEALLGYIHDFDSGWGGGPAAPATLGWRKLLDKCRTLEWAQRAWSRNLLDRIEETVGRLEEATNLDEFVEANTLGALLVRKLLVFMPLPVHIEMGIGGAPGTRGKAVPLRQFAVHADSDLSTITIEIENNDGTSIAPGLYYLPPPWRLGTRLFYGVDPSKHRPILPLRFHPRFDFWRSQAASTPLSVPRELLERAVTLAEQCENESDLDPKVGALIVMDGKILGEGYRNKDGRGSHAEQIAFAATGKSSLSGATLITTLEPCTEGRSNHNTPCCSLILLNGISKVVIGCVDPDERITGRAELLLEENNVTVERFPNDLKERIKAINTRFREGKLASQVRNLTLFSRGRRTTEWED